MKLNLISGLKVVFQWRSKGKWCKHGRDLLIFFFKMRGPKYSARESSHLKNYLQNMFYHFVILYLSGSSKHFGLQEYSSGTYMSGLYLQKLYQNMFNQFVVFCLPGSLIHVGQQENNIPMNFGCYKFKEVRLVQKAKTS